MSVAHSEAKQGMLNLRIIIMCNNQKLNVGNDHELVQSLLYSHHANISE